MCHMGVQWFNQEILDDLSNLGQGEGQAIHILLHPENSSNATEPNSRCYLQLLDWITQKVCVRRPFCGSSPRAKCSSFCDGNGWLGRNVTLVNYDNWAVRITKANINFEGLCMCQLCELQMYAFIKGLPSSETGEVSHVYSPHWNDIYYRNSCSLHVRVHPPDSLSCALK